MDFDEKDYPNLTNEILFNRYIGGDVKAFDFLLGRTKNLIYSMILRYVKNKSQAEEIFQDVYLKVCKNKDQFREAISFNSWLVTICKNTCIDNSRKQNRSLRTDSLDGFEDEDKRSLAEILPSPELTAEEGLTILTEHRGLEGLLDKLPEEQRMTFYLKTVMEFTFEEIGESMKCSTNTAKSRYRYALTALRGHVKRKQLLDKIA